MKFYSHLLSLYQSKLWQSPYVRFQKSLEKKKKPEEMGFGDNDVGEREKSKRIKKSWDVVVEEEAPSYRQGRKELVIR